MGEIRAKGLVSLVLGMALAVLLVPLRVLLPAAFESGLAVAFSLVLGLSVAVYGTLALFVVDAESAAGLRRRFLVTEGVMTVMIFPMLWAWFRVSGELFDEGGAVRAMVPMAILLVALAATLIPLGRVTDAVHRFIAESCEPLVPGDGAGPPAERIRSVGKVLVAVGGAITVALLLVALTSPDTVTRVVFFGIYGMIAGLLVLLQGVRLMRVTDVYSARRTNPVVMSTAVGMLAIFGAGGTAGPPLSLDGGVLLVAVLPFVAVVVMVVAVQTWRGYVGVLYRPWRKQSGFGS